MLQSGVHFFNKGSLKLLLEKAGFNVLEQSEGILYCAKTKLTARTDAEIDTLFLNSPERRFALAVFDQYRTRRIEAQRNAALVVQMAQQLWAAQKTLNRKPEETGLVSGSPM